MRRCSARSGTWAGVIRTRDGYSVGIPFYLIQDRLFGLLQDLESWSGYGMSMVEQATRLHHRAVQIHPFQNGNGRWSRLLSNIWLKLNKAPLIAWPERTIEDASEIRARYIAAIQAADSGDYDPLLKLHQEFQEP